MSAMVNNSLIGNYFCSIINAAEKINCKCLVDISLTQVKFRLRQHVIVSLSKQKITILTQPVRKNSFVTKSTYLTGSFQVKQRIRYETVEEKIIVSQEK